MSLAVPIAVVLFFLLKKLHQKLHSGQVVQNCVCNLQSIQTTASRLSLGTDELLYRRRSVSGLLVHSSLLNIGTIFGFQVEE